MKLISEERETVSAPYRITGRRLLLPTSLPRIAARAFADPAARRLEAGALLYGLRGGSPGDADTVKALVIPDQTRHHFHYRIPYEAIAAASALTRANGLVTLAQVHSHPGRNVLHSLYDDHHTISTRAVSFVLPRYGRRACDWIRCAGVHDYQDGHWHQLTAGQAAQRVSFVDGPLEVFDLREISGEPHD